MLMFNLSPVYSTCHETRPFFVCLRFNFVFAGCVCISYACIELRSYYAHIDLPPRFSITIQILYNAHFLILILHISHIFMMKKREIVTIEIYSMHTHKKR